MTPTEFWERFIAWATPEMVRHSDYPDEKTAHNMLWSYLAMSSWMLPEMDERQVFYGIATLYPYLMAAISAGVIDKKQIWPNKPRLIAWTPERMGFARAGLHLVMELKQGTGVPN